ncbi:MAG: phosphate ABC transporter, permease protein PstA [Rhodobacterales bacterium]|nr:MAG: phosphate ABC transporter, permease protein PstA [Rhodobacterales bacterium]
MTNPLTERTAALRRRHAAEARFKYSGLLAIMIAVGFLIVMVGSIAWIGAGAFKQTQVQLSVYLDPAEIDANALEQANYGKLIKSALRSRFADVKKRKHKKKLYNLVSYDADYALKRKVSENPGLIGQSVTMWFVASDDLDMLIKGNLGAPGSATQQRFDAMQLGWVKALQQDGAIRTVFNRSFFTSGDSREPELAGILGALTGTALTLLVCFVLSFPIGILAAIYLEEFAKNNRWNDLIEVNINNLAAVPSIVFGLLGLAVFLNVFDMPRSSPLVGGLVLALMTLPTMIIAARAALRAVPPSIREAALGIGATRIQMVFHHVAPLALPGMLTGAIVGMARALGETAPLLMIGMVAFIVDIPNSVLKPATVLPVQIFLWADSPERAFLEKTSAAIIVLITFLIVMNLAAILLRNKYSQRF